MKRALAAKLSWEGYAYREIQRILGVSLGFITKWNHYFEQEGIDGLQSHYRGRQRYLTPQQRHDILNWLDQQSALSIEDLEAYIAKNYNVVFRSKRNYYDLLKAAGMSWHKGQRKDLVVPET